MTNEETQQAIQTHIDFIKMISDNSDIGELNKSTIREALDLIKEAIKWVGK